MNFTKYSVLLFVAFVSKFSYAQSPVYYQGPNIPVKTAFNYELGTNYGISDEDDYWKIIHETGAEHDGVARSYSTRPPNTFYLDPIVEDAGNYYYRINVCIEEAEDVVEFKGYYSVDNNLWSVKVDGVVVKSFDLFSEAGCQPNSQGGSQFAGGPFVYGFECVREFSVLLSNTVLSPGTHTIEFEVFNVSASRTGFAFDGELIGASGTILSKDNYTLSCPPPAEIRGKVFCDNGGLSNGSVLLSNIQVLLLDENQNYIRETRTDVTGSYSFHGVDLGRTYYVRLADYSHQLTPGAPYWLEATPTLEQYIVSGKDFGIDCDEVVPPCEECIPSFSPLPGEYYLLSAWVKEDFVGIYPAQFDGAAIQLTFNDGALPMLPDEPLIFKAAGPIVDGWQRIEHKFQVPPTAYNMQIDLKNLVTDRDVYFDDIRIHPFRSNMKSFVYNPATQKLVAELDENNYATFYEYDDEGILIRVKKETERGVQTIKESRNNQSKINN